MSLTVLIHHYFCLVRMNNPIKVMVHPINVIMLIISLKRNHANNEAIMGSPIGVDATMVGDTWRME